VSSPFVRLAPDGAGTGRIELTPAHGPLSYESRFLPKSIAIIAWQESQRWAGSGLRHNRQGILGIEYLFGEVNGFWRVRPSLRVAES
jgi:hypothetical protein